MQSGKIVGLTKQAGRVHLRPALAIIALHLGGSPDVVPSTLAPEASNSSRPGASARGRRCSGSGPPPSATSSSVAGSAAFWRWSSSTCCRVWARCWFATWRRCTRATHPLDALVFLDVLPGQGEAVARFEEHLTRLPHTRHRCGELVRGLGHDVVVLASLRPSVHAAWHAYPVPRPPVPQPLAMVLHPAREPAMMRSPPPDASRPLLGRPCWPVATVGGGE